MAARLLHQPTAIRDWSQNFESTEEYLGKVVQLCLNLPSMACHILFKKLTFGGKLLSADKSTISSTLFTAQAIVGPFTVSIIQQCKMLETMLNIHVLDECLECPETVSMLVKSEKQTIS